jgi:glyoxylase-like metal-dependent hydrolase (beta-lactamase superfamily II)
MNKLLKLRSPHLIFLAVLFLSLPASAEDYAPITVPMEVEQVSEHAYYVSGKAGIATDNEGFISNAGFVVTDAGVVVFDALGTPSLAAALLERIRKITDQPVKYVVMSHYHADHIYGLQVFKELGAEIFAPQGSLDYIHSEAAEDRLLAMLVEQDLVLFSGDIIFEGRVPFVGNADTRHWLKTLTELETGGLAALVPGHGPASKNPASTISLTRRYLAYLRETMGYAIDDLTPFGEAYAEVDWSEFENIPAFKEANRINAYQVYLSMGKELFEN